MANIYPNSITTLPTQGLWHQTYHTHQHSPAAHQEHNLCKESLLCWQPQWYTTLFHYRPDLNSRLFCSAQIWIIRIFHTTGRMLHLQTLRTEATFYFTPALFPSKLRSSLKKEFYPWCQILCHKHKQRARNTFRLTELWRKELYTHACTVQHMKNAVAALQYELSGWHILLASLEDRVQGCG